MKRLYTVALLAALVAVPAAAQAAVLNYVATLEGSQEVPSNPSAATGSGTFSIDTDANTVTYSITFSGMTETAAHIHGFAAPGVNAGVLHALPAGSPKNGVWNYAEAQETDILAGLTYVNVHSATYPGGEIRGQIVQEQSVPVEQTTWGSIKRLMP